MTLIINFKTFRWRTWWLSSWLTSTPSTQISTEKLHLYLRLCTLTWKTLDRTGWANRFTRNRLLLIHLILPLSTVIRPQKRWFLRHLFIKLLNSIFLFNIRFVFRRQFRLLSKQMLLELLVLGSAICFPPLEMKSGWTRWRANSLLIQRPSPRQLIKSLLRSSHLLAIRNLLICCRKLCHNRAVNSLRKSKEIAKSLVLKKILSLPWISL